MKSLSARKWRDLKLQLTTTLICIATLLSTSGNITYIYVCILLFLYALIETHACLCVYGFSGRNETPRFADLGELEESTGFHHEDAVVLSPSIISPPPSLCVSLALSLSLSLVCTSLYK